MRRPIDRVTTKFLADSRDGLDRLIATHTKGKRVVSIDREHVAPSVMFGRFVARVTTEEERNCPWDNAT